MTDTLHRCARGPRCHAYELLRADDDTTTRVGAACDRPLCDVCENSIRRILDDAPTLYVQLRNATLRPGRADRDVQVSISRGSPMPVNTPALHLAEQLATLLADGEDQVRMIARYTRRRTDGLREGRRVQNSARFLEHNITAWISVDTAGPLGLLDWRSAIRDLPGFDPSARKAVRRYQQPCPACEVRAVTHRAGDDAMQCQACGWSQPYLSDDDVRQDGAA